MHLVGLYTYCRMMNVKLDCMYRPLSIHPNARNWSLKHTEKYDLKTSCDPEDDLREVKTRSSIQGEHKFFPDYKHLLQ